MKLNVDETKFVVAEWSPPTTIFDLEKIVAKHNKKLGTSYTLADIQDYWIKWGCIYVLIDEEIVEDEGSDNTEVDYKRPQCELHYDADWVEVEREEK